MSHVLDASIATENLINIASNRYRVDFCIGPAPQRGLLPAYQPSSSRGVISFSSCDDSTSSSSSSSSSNNNNNNINNKLYTVELSSACFCVYCRIAKSASYFYCTGYLNTQHNCIHGLLSI